MKKTLFLLLVLSSSLFAYDYPSVPYSFIPGTIISSSAVNSNFNALVTGLNSGLYKLSPAEIYSGSLRILSASGNITARTLGSLGGLSVSGNSTLYGSLSVYNSILYVGTPNVGIGTTSPSSKFSVVGNMMVTGSITTTGVILASENIRSSSNVIVSNQLKSMVASGTAPLYVKSNTLVPSLNADLLDGHHWSEIPTSITSTASVGYLPIVTSTYNLGSSMIYQPNSSQICIGTTTPGPYGTGITMVSDYMRVNGSVGVNIWNNKTAGIIIKPPYTSDDSYPALSLYNNSPTSYYPFGGTRINFYVDAASGLDGMLLVSNYRSLDYKDQFAMIGIDRQLMFRSYNSAYTVAEKINFKNGSNLTMAIYKQYVGINVSTPNASLVVSGDVRVTGNMNVSGNMTVSGNEFVKGDIYTVALTNYSSSLSTTGWFVFTRKEFYYKKVGKMVFVNFYLVGANDTGCNTTTLTLPYAVAAPLSFALSRCTNDSTDVNGGGFGMCDSGSTLELYWNEDKDAWGVSSLATRKVAGQFFYFTN